MDFKNLLDRYEWQARLFPVLIVIAPIVLSILIWFPETRTKYNSVISLLGTFGLMHLIARISRNLGKSKENSLYKLWGGAPTTQILRHKDETLDSITKKRYHKFLENNINGLKLPTVEDEEKNPNEADKAYQSAVKWLREKTRDKKKYYLIFQENIHYGFSRNLWAFKTYAIIINIINIIMNFVGIYLTYKFDIINVKLEIWVSIIVAILFLLIWITFINKKSVRLSAYAYARVLISVCENIS